MAVRKKSGTAAKAPVTKPAEPKMVKAIRPEDAGLIQSLLSRIELKGEEVPAFNRASALLGHICGMKELPDEVLYPPQQNSQ